MTKKQNPLRIAEKSLFLTYCKNCEVPKDIQDYISGNIMSELSNDTTCRECGDELDAEHIREGNDLCEYCEMIFGQFS